MLYKGRDACMTHVPPFLPHIKKQARNPGKSFKWDTIALYRQMSQSVCE